MKKLPFNDIKKSDNKPNATIICLIFLNITYVLGDPCCKKFDCFECDSRFDSRCGESFNLTRETGTIIPCNEFCVKLKHFYDDDYHYVRTCSSTIKDIYIKKTHVCYTTMTKDDGNLCFCDEDLCNRAASFKISTNFIFYFSHFFSNICFTWSGITLFFLFYLNENILI